MFKIKNHPTAYLGDQVLVSEHAAVLIRVKTNHYAWLTFQKYFWGNLKFFIANAINSCC